MHTLLQDIRYSFRALGKSPGLTFVVVLSMALAIGANTTVFTWLNYTLLNPFPAVPEGRSLLALNPAPPDGMVRGMPPISYLRYVEWRARTRSFTDIALHSIQRVQLRTEGQSQGEPAWTQIVTANYFDVLRMPAQLGRVFTPADESASASVVVISDAFWRRRFAADPGILGRRVRLNGVDVTIIGVVPPRFAGIISGVAFEMWVPLWLQRQVAPPFDWMRDPAVLRMQAFARLKEGVTLAQAREELLTRGRHVSESFGDSPAAGGAIRYVRDTQLGSLLNPLGGAMLVITALVLLTACANVANLLLARATARRKEIAVRLALGASRAHIVRELLVHSLLLAGLGGGAGLFLAFWGKDLILQFTPRVALPVQFAVEMDYTVVAFALAATLATALLFGLVPALRASRLDLAPVLKDEAASGSRRSRLRRVLVVAQVSFCLIALVVAGLFLRSVREANTLALGFTDPGQVLLAATDFTLAGMNEAAALPAVDRLLERVRVVPGVRAAAFSTMVPLGFGGHAMFPARVEGYTPGQDEVMLVEKVFVSDGYFDLMEIPIVQGRAIRASDRRDGLRVAVVNQAFAQRYWPKMEALGLRVDGGEGWATVVGVAKNSAYRDLGEAPYPLVYYAWRQNFMPMATLHLRTAQEPKTVAENVRREFTAVHPDLPFFDPGTLREHLAAATFVQSVGTTMLGSFGLIALAIAGAGLYGVLAYSVAQRRRAIAITVALGATPRRVLGDVLGEGLRLTLVGLLIGGALALGAGRLVSAQLLGVSPFDPLTLAASAALLVLVALAACAVPAWRASRVDPITVLRGN
jgi:predicted permease